jgi:NADH-quinone oxidoreductase subunit L
MKPFLATLIWLFPYLGASVITFLYIAGVKKEWPYAITATTSLFIAAVIATVVGVHVIKSGQPLLDVHRWIPWINVYISTYIDGLSAIMVILVSWLSFLIGVYSVEYMKGDWGYPRYFFFFTFFVGSMLLVVSAENLLMLFIGWEGTGLASYALIGHWYTDEEEYWVGVPGRRALGLPMYFEPSHSGLRAILFTRFGDIGMLIGMAVLYLLTGTLSLRGIADVAGSWTRVLAVKGMLTLVLVLLTLGAFAKSAQFPFHEWLVTAMTGPTPVSALIHAATMVKAGIYFVLRFAPIIFTGALSSGSLLAVLQAREYFLIVAGIGAVTAFILATMALVSNEFKLILAFSTASQIGYMFLAAGAAGAIIREANRFVFASGIAASLSHLMSHAIFKAALFLISGWALHVAHSRFIDKMGEYAKYMKVTTISMWLAGLSLAGIPPLSGFFSKELTLKAAEEAGLTWVYVLGALTALLTAAYTTRLILRVFHLPPYEPPEHKPHEAPPLMLVPYAILALAALTFGLAWTYLGRAFSKASMITLALQSPASLSLHITSRVAEVLGGALISIFIVIALYMIWKVDFRSLIQRSLAARITFDFLFDRWYINSIIYLLFVIGFDGVSYMVKVVDQGIDWFYHMGLTIFGRVTSFATRALHRGRPDYYNSMYLGLTALTLLLFVLMWLR